jgi:hypothetical protein
MSANQLLKGLFMARRSCAVPKVTSISPLLSHTLGIEHSPPTGLMLLIFRWLSSDSKAGHIRRSSEARNLHV